MNSISSIVDDKTLSEFNNKIYELNKIYALDDISTFNKNDLFTLDNSNSIVATSSNNYFSHNTVIKNGNTSIVTTATTIEFIVEDKCLLKLDSDGATYMGNKIEEGTEVVKLIQDIMNYFKLL